MLSNYAFPDTLVHAAAFDEQAAAPPAKTAASWRHFVKIEHRRHRFGGGEDIDETALKSELEQAMPDLVVITLPGDDLALQIAVVMRRALDVMSRCDIPVFVRVRDQSLLSGVLSAISAIPFCEGRLSGFGDLSDVVAPGALFDEHLDILARAVHETYLATKATASPARVAWENLAERFRRSNRQAADHIAAKLHYAGFRAVPGAFPGAVFDDAAVEAMAKAEHYRWCLTLQAHGWRHDPVRSDLLRTHDLLLPWTELPETVRQANRDEVAAIPKALARIGCAVQRIETFAADAPLAT